MTAQPSATKTRSPHSSAGWAAVSSGLLGLMAFFFLIAFLVTRLFLGGTEEVSVPLIRVHDFGAILQFLLMIPVVATLAGTAGQHSSGASRTSRYIGQSALVLAVACLALIFAKVVPDDLYMIPQGFLALWLIMENRRLSGSLPSWLTRLGSVSGFGLLLVAAFPIGFTLFVDRSHLSGWTPFDYQPPPGTDLANVVIHVVLLLGTFIGVATFPVWTLLLGRELFRGDSAPVPVVLAAPRRL